MPAAFRTSDDAVRLATGRPRDEWFAMLDAWGGTDRAHRDIPAAAKRMQAFWRARTVSLADRLARRGASAANRRPLS